MIKIPESIRIGGTEYKIKYVDSLFNDENKVLMGQIDYNACEIRLNRAIGMNDQQVCKTFLHEVLHGVQDHMGFKLDDEETVIDAFARGIFMIIQDNEERLFDPKKGE